MQLVIRFPVSSPVTSAAPGPPARLTSSLSRTARAHSCALYSSCRRSGFSWNRGSFLAGSSSPKQGDCALGTSFTSSTKMKGLNMDLERKESASAKPRSGREDSKHSRVSSWWVAGGCLLTERVPTAYFSDCFNKTNCRL